MFDNKSKNIKIILTTEKYQIQNAFQKFKISIQTIWTMFKKMFKINIILNDIKNNFKH